MNEKAAHNFYQEFPLSVYICTNYRNYCLKENDSIISNSPIQRIFHRGMVILVSKPFHRHRKLAESQFLFPTLRYTLDLAQRSWPKLLTRLVLNPQVLRSSQFQFNFPYLLLFEDRNDQREKAEYQNSYSLPLSSARRNLQELGRQMLCIPSAV